MITVVSGQDTDNIILIEGSYPYYLFAFEGCDGPVQVFTAIDQCESVEKLFTMNIDLPKGVYTVSIYGQDDYSNIDPDQAEFIKNIKLRVRKPNPCDEEPIMTTYYLLDENSNILTDHNGDKLIYQ